MRKLLILLVLILFAFTNAYAEIHAGAGTTGTSFLKMGVGARAVGMGEVFAGIADDISSIYWNPAGLSRMKGREFTGSHTMLYQNINYEFAAFGMPISDNLAFGVGASYVMTDDLERRISDTEEHLGLFGSSDIAGIGAVSMKMGLLSIGASAKFIYQSIGASLGAGEGEYTATGMAFDAGVHFASDGVEFGKGILAGAVVQNIGTGLTFVGPDSFEGELNPLPFNIKAGIAYKDLENNLTVGADVNVPVDNNVNLHFGGEYTVSRILALRMGFKTSTLADHDFLSGVSAGAGINLNAIIIDYAWVPWGDLGFFTHRFSVTAKF